MHALWATILASLSVSSVDTAGGAGVVINEIRYDPPGPDAGGEYVELFNASTAAVHLDATWCLERGNGARADDWTVFWTGDGTILEPGTWCVIGDDPRATLDAVPALQNGPDACRLRRGDETVDLVGWGIHTHAEYVETAGAEDPSPGLLARRPDGVDTNDNHRDLVAAERETPGERNFPDRLLLIEVAFPPTEPALPEPGEAFSVRFSVRAAGLETLSAHGAGVEIAGVPTRWMLDAPLPPGGVRTGTLAIPGRSPGPVSLTLVAIGDGLAPMTRDVALRIGTGARIFSEVEPRGGDDGPEWLELDARVTSPGSLAGWRIIDAGGGEALLPDVIADFPVFTTDRARLLGAHPEIDPAALAEIDLPTLNDRDEVLYLVDRDGLISDAVAFDAPEPGRSLERVHPDLPSRDPAAWVASPFGPTPQRRNGAFAVPPPRATTLRVTPRVVGTQGTEIGFHLGTDGGLLSLIVADAAGHERGRILERTGAARGGLRWDGRIDGERLPPGLYVLVARLERDGRRVEERRAFAVEWEAR
jgi:hypothetical protein